MPSKPIKIQTAVRYLSYGIGLFGFALIARDVSLYYSIPFVCLTIISIYRDASESFIVPRWLLNTIATLIVAIAIMQLNIENLLQNSLQALLVVLAVKFLEQKQFRDYMQIYGITVFLLCGYALMHIDMWFLLYCFLLIFAITSAIVLLTFLSEAPDAVLTATALRKIILRSSFITLLAIPTAVVMFVILPRTKTPLLSFLNRPQTGIVGFTDKVELGSVSAIQEDASVLLRVAMKKVSPEHLYWRAVTMDYFDGKSWSDTGVSRVLKQPSPPQNLATINQIVFLEPYENNYLFALDVPLRVEHPDVRFFDDFTYKTKDPIFRRIRYEATSVLTSYIDATSNLSRYLQLPKKNFDKERQFLAETTVAGTKSDEDVAKAISNRLQSSEFKYSLQSLPQSEDPVRDFLFKSKQGNCEYFASAMAVLLRLQGIPARLVGGFKGADYNDAGGYYIVPQKYAHVWVEAYIKDKGWMRFDPTPAGAMASEKSLDMLTKLRLYLDIINYYWITAVINYDFQRQFRLFSTVSANIKKPEEIVSFAKKFLVPVVTVLLISVALFYLGRQIVLRIKHPEELILKDFLAVMAKKGYIKSQSEGLHEFVLRVDDEQLRQKALSFAVTFESLFYKDKQFTPQVCKELRKLIP